MLYFNGWIKEIKVILTMMIFASFLKKGEEKLTRILIYFKKEIK